MAAKAGLDKLQITFAVDGVKYDAVNTTLKWELVVPAEKANADTTSQVRTLLLDGPVSAALEKSS